MGSWRINFGRFSVDHAQGDRPAHVHGCGHLAERGQCSVFVRNREQLAAPPVGLALDESPVEQLAQLVSHWAAAALAQPS